MSVSKSRNLEIWIVLNSKKNTQLNCIFALSMTNKHSFLWQNPFKKECFVVDRFKSGGGITVWIHLYLMGSPLSVMRHLTLEQTWR